MIIFFILILFHIIRWVTSSPFFIILLAWTTMRSPMKYLERLLSQLRQLHLQIKPEKVGWAGCTCGWEAQTLGTDLFRCSWSCGSVFCQINSTQFERFWHRNLFSKSGSFASWGSGWPSITLCVFHWRRKKESIQIGQNGNYLIYKLEQEHKFKDLTHFSNISSIQSKNGNLGCRRFGLTLCYLFKKAEIVCNGCCRTSESPCGISLCYFYLSVIFPSWRNNKECYFSHGPFLHICFILIEFLKSSTSLSANPSTTLWTFHWMKQWIINAIFCGVIVLGW